MSSGEHSGRSDKYGEIIPCPNPNCVNYNRPVRCWNCCNHCGRDIMWRPKNLDWSIRYTGPKPLNKSDGKPHSCMEGGTKDGKFYHSDSSEVVRSRNKYYKTGDPVIDNINYSEDLRKFLQHGYRCLQRHYDWSYLNGTGLQQPCGIPDCQCATVEKSKDPERLAAWKKEVADWVAKWPVDRRKNKK